VICTHPPVRTWLHVSKAQWKKR